MLESTKPHQVMLEILNDRFLEGVQSVADDVRKNLVIPACKAYNLEFFSGNGTWFFGHRTLRKWVFDPVKHPMIKAASEALHLEVSRDVLLGEYVMDYPER